MGNAENRRSPPSPDITTSGSRARTASYIASLVAPTPFTGFPTSRANSDARAGGTPTCTGTRRQSRPGSRQFARPRSLGIHARQVELVREARRLDARLGERDRDGGGVPVLLEREESHATPTGTIRDGGDGGVLRPLAGSARERFAPWARSSAGGTSARGAPPRADIWTQRPDTTRRTPAYTVRSPAPLARTATSSTASPATSCRQARTRSTPRHRMRTPTDHRAPPIEGRSPNASRASAQGLVERSMRPIAKLPATPESPAGPCDDRTSPSGSRSSREIRWPSAGSRIASTRASLTQTRSAVATMPPSPRAPTISNGRSLENDVEPPDEGPFCTARSTDGRSTPLGRRGRRCRSSPHSSSSRSSRSRIAAMNRAASASTRWGSSPSWSPPARPTPRGSAPPP